LLLQASYQGQEADDNGPTLNDNVPPLHQRLDFVRKVKDRGEKCVYVSRSVKDAWECLRKRRRAQIKATRL
jgi:hypothetical protein